MVRSLPFCYSKPEKCKSDAEVQKSPDWEWAILGIIERLEADWSYSEVADWLNEHNVPISPQCRRKAKKWNGALVRDFVFNTLLKGERRWNKKKAMRVNKTGKRKSVKAAPDELLKRSVPHLAYIDAERYDSLIFKLTKRGEKFSVPKRRQVDPRKGRPKKRTRWPGQQVYCELCGAMFVFGGHGQKDHLMCNGAREYQCWNGVTFDSVLAAQRISQAVFDLLIGLPEFDPAITSVLHEEAAQHVQTRNDEFKRVVRDLERAKREEDRLVEAVKQGDDLAVLVAAMKEAQSVRQSLDYECQRLKAQPSEPVRLPTMDEIRCLVRGAVAGLALDSVDFAAYMRRIIDRIVVFPVRLCDGGNPVLRARFDVNFAVHVPGSLQQPSIVSQLRQTLIVDLFKMPQRAEYREAVMAARAQGIPERVIAEQLGLTITAVQRAAALHRLMVSLGLTDPYVPLTEPPADSNRFRRHRHERFRSHDDGQGEAA